ncbi:MAG: AAA family ATPase [Nanoarchaeota archaeon]|nr:AAA family ATPase [Nanoarchaeota archaeon]
MENKDNSLSLDELDAKYGLPLFESKGKPGIYAHINPDKLGFKTTAELKAPKGLERILGQDEQVSAIMEGLAIQRPDYNLIIQCGSEHDIPLLIKVVTEEYAKTANVANVANADQISWQNFSEPLRPKTGSVPAGYAKVFRDYIEKELEKLGKYELKADEIPGFKEHMADMTNNIIKKTEMVEKIEKEAFDKFKKAGIEVERTEDGAITIKNMKDLTLEQKKKVAEIGGETQKKLSEQLQETMGGINEFMEQNRAPIIRSHILATGSAIIAQYDEMVKKGTLPADMVGAIKEYITDVFTYIAEHPEKLKDEKPHGMPFLMMGMGPDSEKGISELLPHIIVDNTGREGLISIVETDPDPGNLLGGVEYGIKPSHMRLNAGLLARANRGLLTIAHADWGLHPRGMIKYKLLQALETGKVDIGGLSIFDKVDAKCDANAKLMLFVSDAGKFFSLFEENERLVKPYFKKRITLETRMPMTLENLAKLGKAVKGEVADSNLPDFDNHAVARLAEYLMLPFGKDKLSTDVSFYRDILIRAGISAKNAGRKVATEADIEVAYTNYKHEKNDYERRVREYMEKGSIIFGDKPEVGVSNGLFYMGAEIPFGMPVRMGVTVRPNKKGVGRFVNIDEKAELAKEMSVKSFLQVASMLKEMYMSMETQFSFDLEASKSQTDTPFDGPSAGAAMSLACISALSNVPTQPYVFFTGGIEPKSGKVTPVGGINEKVMGVYYTCRDLDIKQATVVIPRSNADILHLVDREVQEAIKAGRFKVYTHAHIDETIEIGMRMKATNVHAKVKEQLNIIQEWAKKTGKNDEE